MGIKIDETNLKQGLLGLVVALVEVITDTLKIQALKRMESGILSDEECERLGIAMMDLDLALEGIKTENGLAESVQSFRDGLDKLVDDVVDKIANPAKWEESTRGK
jgi:hypothetical protein